MKRNLTHEKNFFLLKLNWENALVTLASLLTPVRPYLTLCLFIIICIKNKVGSYKTCALERYYINLISKISQ